MAYKTILSSILIFLIFFFQNRWLGLDSVISGWIRNFEILFLLLLQISRIFETFRSEYKSINKWLLVFSIIAILSIVVNADSISFYNTSQRVNDEIQDFKATTNFKYITYDVISLFLVAVTVQVANWKQEGYLMLKTLFVLFLFVVIYNDIDALSVPYWSREVGVGYFVGNKFITCYYHLYLVLLYTLLKPQKTFKRNVVLLILSLGMFSMSIYTMCSTMMVGSVIFFFISFFLKKKYLYFLAAKKAVLIALFVCDILFFVATTWFLSFPVVQDFIVNVLHEDLTLTGRLGIYENIIEAFHDHLFLGYGYGNSILVAIYYTGALDSQNGLIELFLQVGILGCVSYFATILAVLHKASHDIEVAYPIIAFLYVTIYVSMIEIPFTITFLVFILLSLVRPKYKKLHNSIQQ